MSLTERTMGLFKKTDDFAIDKRFRDAALIGDDYPIAKTMHDAYLDTMRQCDTLIKEYKKVMDDYKGDASKVGRRDGSDLIPQMDDLSRAMLYAKLSKYYEARGMILLQQETSKCLARLMELDEASSVKDQLADIMSRVREDPGLSVMMMSDAAERRKPVAKREEVEIEEVD